MTVLTVNENKSNDFNLLIALIVLVALIFYGFEYVSPFFYECWRWLRVGQLAIFSWLPDWGFAFGDTMQNMQDLRSLDNSQLSKNVVDAVDGTYYPIFGWIAVGVMFFLASRIGKVSEPVFEKLSMEGILQKYAKSFPALEPYVNFNPAAMEDITFTRDDKEKIKYLPALQPVEYATMVPPLFLEKEAEDDASLRLPIWSESDGFDDDLAEKAFKKQLGSHFTGLENMEPVEKRVYSYFVTQVSFNKAEMQSLMMKMANHIIMNKGAAKKIKYTGAKLKLYKKINEIYSNRIAAKGKKGDPSEIKNEKFINKLTLSKEFKQPLNDITGESIMNNHAYVYTGLMTMLDIARKGGVIPPVDFLYIKHENRTLFYALSSVGKKVSYVESAGVFAHWLLETHINRPIPTAEVSEAINGLKTALYIEEKNKESSNGR